MKLHDVAVSEQRLGPGVRLLIAGSYDDMSLLGAKVVVDTLLRRPDAVISLTTGNTPAGLYRLLPGLCASQGIDLAKARYISSEEYLGVAAGSPISLFGWLERDVFAPNHIPADRVLRLAGEAPDPKEECHRFDAAIEQLGGIDLVLQTIGVNGHFGFNEPGCAPDAVSRAVELAPSTREANSRYWMNGTTVPTHGFTMGLRQTLQARHVLLLAAERAKAEALREALTGPVNEAIPCSLLRLARCLTVIADNAAGSLLIS